MADRCAWTEDGDEWDSIKWDTDCGEAFVFLEGAPIDNNIRFCCYCGKLIEARPYVVAAPAREEA